MQNQLGRIEDKLDRIEDKIDRIEGLILGHAQRIAKLETTQKGILAGLGLVFSGAITLITGYFQKG